jgi:hypothetical protein
MNLEKMPDGQFRIFDGGDSLTLSKERYEDIFFSIPLASGTLFRLMNDTILETPEARGALKRMIDRAGGLDAALGKFQESVKSVQP